MALSAAALSTAIQIEFISEFGAPADSSKLEDFATAIATAIVAHIQAEAVVTASGTDSNGDAVTVTGTVN